MINSTGREIPLARCHFVDLFSSAIHILICNLFYVTYQIRPYILTKIECALSNLRTTQIFQILFHTLILHIAHLHIIIAVGDIFSGDWPLTILCNFLLQISYARLNILLP